MSRKLKACLIALIIAVMPVAAIAEDNDTVSGDKTTDMVVDLVVVRPLGLVATVLTVVGLPFTVPSGSVGSSAHELIVKPAEYTFTRPLGAFRQCGEDSRACGGAGQ